MDPRSWSFHSRDLRTTHSSNKEGEEKQYNCLSFPPTGVGSTLPSPCIMRGISVENLQIHLATVDLPDSCLAFLRWSKDMPKAM